MDDTLLSSISQRVMEMIASWPLFSEWPECQQALLNLTELDDARVRALPVLGCLAAGGQVDSALHTAAAWSTLRHAANFLDDLQDDRPLGSTSRPHPGQASACTVGMIFAAFSMITSSPLTPGVIAKVTDILSLEGFKSSLGQSLALGAEKDELTIGEHIQHYWKTVILKSGSIYRAGLLAGASAGAIQEASLLQAIGEYGRALGVIHQVLDDCRDALQDKQAHRRTLPWLLLEIEREKRSRQAVPGKFNKHFDSVQAGSWPDQLVAARVPEIISSILAEWGRLALSSLDRLPESGARENLREMLENALNHPSQ